MMARSWQAAIVKELRRVWFIIQGPDPKETIALYRERQATEKKEYEDLLIATQNLVGAVRRLAVVTWVLAGLAVTLVMITAIQIILTFARGSS
jgi:hypothetical protein